MFYDKGRVPDTISYEKLLRILVTYNYPRTTSTQDGYTRELTNELLRLYKEVHQSLVRHMGPTTQIQPDG